MSDLQGQNPTPKKQVEFSGTGGGGGAKKLTAVGTGGDGEGDWLSNMTGLVSLMTEASKELQQLLSEIATQPGVA